MTLRDANPSNKNNPKRVAIVIANPATSSTTDWPVNELLAKGKTVTGFADVEEDFADNAVWGMGALPKDKHLMPWRIEGELKKLGANFVQAGMWRGFAVRDGNLITGQQNFSGTETANLVVATLGH